MSFPPLKIFNQLNIPTHSMYGVFTFIYLLKLPKCTGKRPASLSGPGIGFARDGDMPVAKKISPLTGL